MYYYTSNLSILQKLTLLHILIECVDFSETRNELYTTNTLKELFEKVPSNKIIDYVIAIGIYNLI